MTEPNKELPKEVVEKIRQSAIHEVGGDYEGGAKGIIKDGIIQRKTEGAEIAQSHYAPIIEAKDKQLSEKDKIIKLLNDRIEDKRDVEEQYLDRFHAQKGKPTQSEIIAEKDKRIAELESWACNRVWQDAYNVINEAFCDQQTAKDYADNQLKQFKEENGIDLGGE